MAGTERVEPETVKATPAPMTVGAADDVAELDADRRAERALGWLAAQRPMDLSAPEEPDDPDDPEEPAESAGSASLNALPDPRNRR